jgi:osmoprotectant transport system substrate-binding protein
VDSLTRSFGAKFLILLVLLVWLLPSACEFGGGPTESGTPTKGPIRVGGKQDTEAQLLTEMYSQLLKKGGFTVDEHLAFGNTPSNFAAIITGDLDLYPEFTATGLSLLKIPSVFDPEKDYQAVKKAYEKQFRITWLDRSPLNDGYSLCMTKDESQGLNVTTLSQLAPMVSRLILESPSDGIPFVDSLKGTYGFDTKSFKKTETTQYSLGFTAVTHKQAQVTVCYGTDVTVSQQNFLYLKDDKNGFPAFNPAPIARNGVLSKYPEIASLLNPLAPYLTTDVSIMLQQQVRQKQASGMSAPEAVKEVTTDFLKSKGLL